MILNFKYSKNDNAFKWLILAIFSLALSGIFAIFLVIARSPKICKLLPYPDLFKTTLTIHVNLSVLVWLLSFSAFYIIAKNAKESGLQKIAFYLSLFGTIIIAGSIFDISANAYLNNYVPYLDSKIFSSGILIFLSGILLISIQGLSLLDFKKITLSKFVPSFEFLLSSIIFIAFIVLALTFYNLQKFENTYSVEDYYEILYWGFGHILQFAYTFVMLISWLFALNYFNILQEKNYYLIENINNKTLKLHTILALIGVVIILKYNVTDYEYKAYYTRHMAVFGGLSAIIILLNNYKIFLHILFASKDAIKNAIIWSVILFFSGGFISLFISGSDTRIPAHYHGSIIGVSLALMGAVYIFLQKNNYQITNPKLAKFQPVIYGSGQLIHIIGLAISGGYGALRKNPGVAESFEGKFYMGLMGAGGLISIIGGLIFVVIVIKTIIKSNKTN
jgi:heme/copper-type cytochrome/quinol oxidase subunit 1